MIPIACFGSQMQYIRRVCFITANPIGNIFTKSAADLRVKPDNIILTEMFQSCLCPVSHRHHYGFLIHVELSGFIKLKAPFPCVTEAVWPLTRMTIFLMPNEFFCPKPPLTAKFKNQLDNIGMSLPVNNLFFNVKYERSFRFKNSEKLFAAREKPPDVLIRRNPAVSFGPTIGIRW